MNFFMVLIVTWYYGHILASPIDQTQTEEYPIDQTQTEEYPIDQTQTEEYIYYDFDYDSDICILPAEFGHVGKSVPMFECQTLNMFKSPPYITNFNGNHISVCCPNSNNTSDVPPPPPTEEDYKDDYNQDYKDDYKQDYKDNYNQDYKDDYKLDYNQDFNLEGSGEEIPIEYEYDYEDYYSCKSDSECLPLSQCDSNSIISDEFLPTYCTDSSKTDQDHFCCDKNSNIIEQNHVGDDVPHVKEPPIFTKANDKPWPCVDHTEMCKTWAKTHPDSCKPGDDHYEFMKLACMESCQICKDHGCVDTFKKCPEWARAGHCTRYPQEMMFHCRESCGTCGFKSIFNREPQSIGSKQYTDLNSPSFDCGNFKKKNESDISTRLSETSTRCTSTIISDRFILTAAQCVPETSASTSVITIRTGTELEETIAVRRKFIHPKYNRGDGTYYNDIAVLELERKILYDYEKYGDSPTCLNEDCDIAGEESILQGFGKTETGEFPDELLETTVKTITTEECKNWMNTIFGNDTIEELPNGIERTILCTKGIESDKGIFSGACEGDEGSPLYINAEINDKTGDINKRTLAGIYSGSGTKECGKKNVPNYWQRVSEFLPWIKCVKRLAEENKASEEIEKECKFYINSSQPKCMVDKVVDNRISKVPNYEKIMKAYKYFVKLPWGYFAWGAL